MIKITANHNKQDTTYTFTAGQTFPKVEGKLLAVEVSGKELAKLMEKKDIPLCSPDTSYLVWHGKQAGGILKILLSIFVALFLLVGCKNHPTATVPKQQLDAGVEAGQQSDDDDDFWFYEWFMESNSE